MRSHGWFQERFRHSLAARGVKTSRKKNRYSNIDRKLRKWVKPAKRKSKDWKLRAYLAEKLIGGNADGVPDYKFDPDALYQGIMVELEHTNDPEIAEEIAKDHLVEDPDYYKKLAEIEGQEAGFSLKFFAKKGEPVHYYDPDYKSPEELEEEKRKKLLVFEHIAGGPVLSEGARSFVKTVLPSSYNVSEKRAKKILKETQGEIAEKSDEAYRAVEKGDDEAFNDVYDWRFRELQEDQELARRGKERSWL